MYQLTPKKRHPLLNVVLFIFILSIATEVLKLIFGNSATVDEQLVATSNEINKHCPMVVDSSTRLDNTVALPNHKFQYNYSFYHYLAADIDTGVLKANTKELIINKLKTDPKLSIFRENNVEVDATFYDKSGKYICSLIVTPTDY